MQDVQDEEVFGYLKAEYHGMLSLILETILAILAILFRFLLF